MESDTKAVPQGFVESATPIRASLSSQRRRPKEVLESRLEPRELCILQRLGDSNISRLEANATDRVEGSFLEDTKNPTGVLHDRRNDDLAEHHGARGWNH